MIRFVTTGLVSTALVLMLAPPAAAQLGLGPIVGVATGHVGVAAGLDGAGTAPSGGVSVAVVEQSGWGVEFDAGFASDDGGRSGGLNAQTYVLNVLGAWPKGKLRPFFTAGGGAMRARTCVESCPDTVRWADWALSAGGGVHYLFSETFGLRGDARYFSSTSNRAEPDRAGRVRFWRISVGASFLWSAQ